MTWVPLSRLAFGHSARRLAFGQTKSYSVQPPLHTESFSSESGWHDRVQLYSSELSYIAVAINISSSKKLLESLLAVGLSSYFGVGGGMGY